MARPDRTPLRLYFRAQAVTDREVAALLLRAAQAAEDSILALGRKQGIGAQVQRAQLQLASRVLRQEAAQLWPEIERSIRAGIERSAVAAAQAQNLATRILMEAAPGIDAATFASAVEAQARQGVQSLLSRRLFRHSLSQRVFRTSVGANGTLQRVINEALAQGKTWRQLATDVRRLISPRTPGGVSYAAERLARTELNNAFHTTQIRMANPNPFIQGMRWNLSSSHPEGDICDSYDGRVFNKRDVPGKPHPQCFCYLTPEVESEDEFINNFLVGKYDRYLNDTLRVAV